MERDNYLFVCSDLRFLCRLFCLEFISPWTLSFGCLFVILLVSDGIMWRFCLVSLIMVWFRFLYALFFTCLLSLITSNRSRLIICSVVFMCIPIIGKHVPTLTKIPTYRVIKVSNMSEFEICAFE